LRGQQRFESHPLVVRQCVSMEFSHPQGYHPFANTAYYYNGTYSGRLVSDARSAGGFP
jgi:hypothetical protein